MSIDNVSGRHEQKHNCSLTNDIITEDWHFQPASIKHLTVAIIPGNVSQSSI